MARPHLPKPTGTQTLERSTRLLRELATRPRVGWGLTELALRCELDKGTTHRMLQGLVRERLAARHPSAPRYLPGPLLFELSLSVGAHAELQNAGKLAVERISRRLGGISALTLASGQDAVCCAHHGSIATKAVSFNVGDRRPLVMNSAGVAMLIRLPADEVQAATTYGLTRAQHLGSYRVSRIQSMIKQSVKLGYGLNQNHTVAGITGVAIALLDAGSQPVAALSVSGRSDQFPPNAIPQIVAELRREAQTLPT